MTEPNGTLVRRGGWREDIMLNRRRPPYGPRNAWSNVAYLFAGFFPLPLVPGYPAFMFALAMGWLAYGSFTYHAYKTVAAHKADWSGMYAVFGVLAAYAYSVSTPAAGPVMAAVGVSGALLAYVWRAGSANALIGVLLVLSFVPAYFNGDSRLAIASLGLFLAAKACWVMDKNTAYLGLWGHALWHVLTAAALACMFLSLGG